MECVPVKFECFDEIGVIFTIEANDEYTATIEIKQLITLESWCEINTKVREAIIAMGLK